MKKIIPLLKNQFDWIKRDLLLLISLNFLVSLLLHWLKVPAIVLAITIAMLLLKNAYFARFASLSPTVNQGVDRFSWKYLRMLPLTTRELLTSLAVTKLLAFLPFISVIVFFFADFHEFFADSRIFSIGSLLKTILIGILAIASMSFVDARAVVDFPRSQFQKHNSTEKFYLALKEFLLMCVYLLYLGIALVSLEVYVGLSLGPILGFMRDAVVYIFESWVIIPVLGGLALSTLVVAENRITDEKLSYTDHKWDQKRVYLTIGASLVLLLAPIKYIDFKTPFNLRGLPGVKYLFSNDEDSFRHFVESHSVEELSRVNRYGHNLLLASARSGKLFAYDLLIAKGLSYKTSMNDEITNIKFASLKGKNIELIEKVMRDFPEAAEFSESTGNSLLHLAADNCHAEAIEFLLKNGSNPNIKNQKGVTPLMLASDNRSCFGAIVALQAGGADFDLKDEKGNNALELAKKYGNVEKVYYLKKYTRAPASQK